MKYLVSAGISFEIEANTDKERLKLINKQLKKLNKDWEVEHIVTTEITNENS